MTTTTQTSGRHAVHRPVERRTVLQLVLGIVLYAICQVLMTVAAVGVFAATATGDSSATVGDILATPAPAAVGFAVGAAAAIAGFILIVRTVSKRKAVEFSGPGALRELGWGLLIGSGVVAAAVGILSLIGVYRVDSVQLSAGILTGIMFGLGPAVMEEVFFRGFLLRILDGWWGPWISLITVSVVFALVHGLSSPAGPIAAVFVFLSASLLLNMAFFLTRRLWLPIALHFAFNATQGAIFGLNVSGSDTGSGLFSATLQGPDWLTGGVMGGEGSAILIGAALATGIVLTVLAVRRGAMRPDRRP